MRHDRPLYGNRRVLRAGLALVPSVSRRHNP